MRKIAGQERADLIATINARINADTQIIAAPEREAVWERGWAEAKEKFRKYPHPDSLIPAFIHDDQPVRYRQEFCWPESPLDTELTHIRYMQEKIGDWFWECDHVAEFGCGTGFNLVALAERYPDKTYSGFDFAQSAVDLVHEVWHALNLPLSAHKFDMADPYYGMMLPKHCGVFTFGSIEQLAGNFRPFIEYLIAQKPEVVVHVEPCVELLDPDNEVDALAIRFMRKRGYTEGLLPFLQNDPRIEMLEVERTGFGSLMIEAYNIFAWRLRA